jgi:hypothetical protein
MHEIERIVIAATIAIMVSPLFSLLAYAGEGSAP